MHLARNWDSGSAPGGRISFPDALLDVEIRKRGTTAKLSAAEKIHLRRAKSMDCESAGEARIGKVMAAVGHFAEQE
jgi:hypothetical protein